MPEVVGVVLAWAAFAAVAYFVVAALLMIVFVDGFKMGLIFLGASGVLCLIGAGLGSLGR
jgi:hypothetical protein